MCSVAASEVNCLSQANWRLGKFPSATKWLAPNLLSNILEHVSSQDNQVRNAGVYALRASLCRFTSKWQEAAATTILTLLHREMQVPGRIATWLWTPLRRATECLSICSRLMSPAQRQECVALITAYFQFPTLHREAQLEVISELRIFWRADASPWKTYAAEAAQLSALQRRAVLPEVAADPKVRDKLFELLHC